MLFPSVTGARVLVVSDEPTEGLAMAALLGDLDDLTSVGTALPGGMPMAMRLREPTVLVSLGAADLADFPQPVVALVHDDDEARDALDLGALAVLRRGSDPARVEAALRAVMVGLRVLDFELDRSPIPAPPVESPVFASESAPSLTPRERQVLELLADGLSNKDIAQDLEIGERTAKFHVAALLKKLDAQTRTEAVVRAARLGLLLL